MASRIDPFFRVVFERLNEQGLSYRAVCCYLLSQDVTISPQALRSWHLRRSRKIATRSLQTMAQVLAPAPGADPACAPLDRPFATREQAMAAPVSHASHSLSAGLTPLQTQIEDEERLLLLQSAGQNFFPVRRKQLTNSNEQRLSTIANGQTEKGIK